MTTPKTSCAFALTSKSPTTLELDVFDIVGVADASAKAVRAQLKAASKTSTIKVRINSRGGDVIDGFAIYNLLNDHPGRVEVEIVGLAASMASVIACAGDVVRIAQTGFMMIHRAWGVSVGE